jgi:hypothetical protein
LAWRVQGKSPRPLIDRAYGNDVILLLASNISTNFHRISEETDFNAVNSPYNSLENGLRAAIVSLSELANGKRPASPEAELNRHG